MIEVFATTPVPWKPRATLPAFTNAGSVMVAQPLRSDHARAGKCYNNVQDAIARHGGDAAYGWALADLGPHRALGGKLPPPLYGRFMNHVLWRDSDGKLWEVTPTAVVQNKDVREFKPTEFILDSSATFEHISAEDWYTRPTRYLPMRPEGIATAHYLTMAQRAQDNNERNQWLGEALQAIAVEGFKPLVWKVEMLGDRMGRIWLNAE